jgi:hypothetical protein
MFQSRTSSQKPGDELLANFRQQFPQIIGTTSPSSTAPALAHAEAGDNPLLNPPNGERLVFSSFYLFNSVPQPPCNITWARQRNATRGALPCLALPCLTSAARPFSGILCNI